eukprot:TRINITY_DN75545_c0_g1_i1.p1 TRINITY_DN75545_c0_g1~~TRINITY_DN75545_c0_g1_i1.p1  ORF type:complete len:358 (+),score=58.87 TRINITY_DN75545_c0_g1_i1:66-1139(+)
MMTASEQQDAKVNDPQRWRGTVKSYCSSRGFGFITCPQAAERYGRDVYLHQREVGDMVMLSGAPVLFDVFSTKDGQPQARNIEHDEDAANIASVSAADAAAGGKEPNCDVDDSCCASRVSVTDAENASKKTFTGIVKSFVEEKGFGFIECEETHQIFNRDVFLHHSQLSGFAVGDKVQFRVSVDTKGLPKSYDLARVDIDPSGDRAMALTNGFTALKLALSGGHLPRQDPRRRVVRESSSEVSAAAPAVPAFVDDLSCNVGVEDTGEPIERENNGSNTSAQEAPEASDPSSNRDTANQSAATIWQRCCTAEGQQWWWREADGSWFMESDPGDWQRFRDPKDSRVYWWRSDSDWFWAE